MRVGVNLLYMIPGVVGGTETYARGLLKGFAAVGFAHEFVIFLNEEAEKWPLPSRFHRVVCPVVAMHRARRYAFEQLRLPTWARVERLDVLHSLGYVAPLRTPCASVVTIPDLNTIDFGGQLSWAKRIVLGTFTRWSARRADHILTISSFSRDRICRALRVPREKVTVTPLASNHLCAPAGNRTHVTGGHPYFVAFSSTSPNKNVPLLLNAFEKARVLGLEYDLLLVGHQPSSGYGRIPSGVRFTGWLPDDQRDVVVAGANALVFPSLYEGFGLPVLEAMALGVPVLSSNRASLPEVGGAAAEYFDPENVDEIAAKLVSLAADPAKQKKMREAGFQNTVRFSWEKTATSTLVAYDEAFAARRHSRLALRGEE